MAPSNKTKGCRCKGNLFLIDKLLELERIYSAKRNKSYIFTIRRVVSSLRECDYVIRNRSDALKLKGVGSFIANKIQSYLVEAHLLDVPPTDEDMLPIDGNEQIFRLTDVTYLPKPNGGSWCVTVALWKEVIKKKQNRIFILDIQLEFTQFMNYEEYDPKRVKKEFLNYLHILEMKKVVQIVDPQFYSFTLDGYHTGCAAVYVSFETNSNLNSFCLNYCLNKKKLLEEIHSSTPTLVSITNTTSETSLSTEIHSSNASNFSKRVCSVRWPLSSTPEYFWGTRKIEESENPYPFEKETLIDQYDILESQRDDLREEILQNKSNWQVVLVLDTRETLHRTNRSYFYNQLTGNGIPVELRMISIGDVQFLLRNQIEYIMDFIVERKTVDDLAHSVLDGRFMEQKTRLHRSNIHNVFYLIEGEITSQEKLDKIELYKKMLSILVHDHFHVYQSVSVDDSIRFLTCLYEYIYDLYRTTNFCYLQCENYEFNAFQKALSKTTAITVKDLWTKQLTTIPRCSLSKAIAITSSYPTMNALYSKYKSLQTEQEKETLLKDIIVKYQKQKIGKDLSTFIYHFLNDSSYS